MTGSKTRPVLEMCARAKPSSQLMLRVGYGVPLVDGWRTEERYGYACVRGERGLISVPPSELD